MTQQTPNELLRCEGVKKRFGGIVAVDGIDITIEPGKVYGLIGPNGAGKSTLFNTISGLYPVTAGEIYLKGTNITDLPQHKICRAGIARTFQSPRPFGSLSVLENVSIGLEYGRDEYDDEDAHELLELVSLSQKADAEPSDLTMFERKSLDLARALATAPDILLIDEIMAGLNEAEVNAFLNLIDDLSVDYTIFLIEHIMEAVMEVSDTVIVLQNGKKISEGPPEFVSSDDAVIKAYLGDDYDNT